MLRNELAMISTKYDFGNIENDKRTIDAYRMWSETAVRGTNGVVAMFETFFNCGLCRNLAVGVTFIEPIIVKSSLPPTRGRGITNLQIRFSI